MTPQSKNTEADARRAELLVELLLQELGPAFVARPSSIDFGFDFFVGFRNPQGGMNVAAVQVKGTLEPDLSSINVNRAMYSLLVASNLPVFLFVVDTKRNAIFMARPGVEDVGTLAPKDYFRVPVLTIDGMAKDALLQILAG